MKILITAKQNQKFSFLNFRFSAGGVGGADKKMKGNFWFLLPRPKGADEARRIRAYDLVSLHHARGACDIICFGSRCEFGTIETPYDKGHKSARAGGGRLPLRGRGAGPRYHHARRLLDRES